MKEYILVSLLLLLGFSFVQAQDASTRKPRKDLFLAIHKESRELHHDHADHHGDAREYFKHHRMEKLTHKEHRADKRRDREPLRDRREHRTHNR